MSGGSKVTTTEPWAEQQEYLTKGFARAEDLYGRGMPAYYPGTTLAGFDPEQRRAQASMLNYARGPRVGGMQAGAERALLSKLGGQTPFTEQQTSDLLAGRVNTGAGTPYGALADVYRQQFEDQAGKGLQNVRQGLVSYQPGGGSRGDIYAANVVSSAQKALAQNLAQMYGGAYQQAQGMRFPAAEMQLGQRAAGQAAYPTIMGAPLQMYGAIGDVGAQRRAMTQEAINQAQAKYQYEQGREQSALQQYMANISGDYGGTTTQTPSGLSQLGQLIGIMGGAKVL